MGQTEDERKQDELKAKNTIRALTIFSLIVLALMIGLGFVGYNICDTPVDLEKAALFTPLGFASAGILIAIGVVWYKEIKEHTCPKEKEGVIKKVEISEGYIVILIVIGICFLAIASPLCMGAIDFLSDPANALEGLDWIVFVVISETLIGAALMDLTIGVLFVLGIVYIKEMNTIEEKLPAPQPPASAS